MGFNIILSISISVIAGLVPATQPSAGKGGISLFNLISSAFPS
jgi:hypothetical protein